MNKFFVVTLSSFLFFASCSQFGENPSGDHLEEIKKSPNYDIEINRFKNRIENMWKQMSERDSFWDNPRKRISNNYFFNSAETIPENKLPEVKPPNIKEFMKSTKSIKFIWFGHSTLLVNIKNTIILIDPVFSKAASPVSFLVKRFQPPVLELNDLPRIDYVLISHDHYDHLDMETVIFFKEKDVKFITPLGVTSHLKSWDMDRSKLFEADWWGTLEFEGITFICTPAQHFSGRLATFSSFKTLWASWIVKTESNSFYFSGDSGYDIHYKDIGDKYGPFELVFMDSGQYNERWREVHNMPDEAAQAVLDLKGKVMVPIHWGMFNLAIHDWYEPVEESEKYAEKYGIKLMTPKLGQLVSMERQNVFEKWWKDFMDE
ncbi:MBL fold metallo-hydrolase [Deltaproteobacteria bacterium]|nr:MBL fold metallo-hydrolase [Deltaproteobacteria bacterium]